MKKNISVIGLGYVGLPLAVEFAKHYKTIGFDTNKSRISELNECIDSTLEVESDVLSKVIIKNKDYFNESEKGLFNTAEIEVLRESNIYIITVPTPTDKHNIPDLKPLKIASEMVGKVLSKGDYVIYESTVYPGVTEDECIPVLQESSGLILNIDFFVGYSPERIVPGDKERTLTKIKKVTSGSTPECALYIDNLYKTIITAGTHLAQSIKIAEASKVIENSQRDINIAFVNELARIFTKMKIDTKSVLEAASTKWNFLPFKPGLVGGHCIGVDPYYLAQKSQESGYYPEIILAGRRINDSMGRFVSSEVIKVMINNNIRVDNSKILILGFSFKENCPDFRNTKIIDIYKNLKEYNTDVSIFDPWINKDLVKNDYGIEVIIEMDKLANNYEVIIHAVSHDIFKEINFNEICSKNKIIYDVKGTLPENLIDARL